MSVLKDKFLLRFRLGIIATVLTGCVTLGPQLEWGSQYATPGTQLSLQHLGPGPAGSKMADHTIICEKGGQKCTSVRGRMAFYRLGASGFPQGRPLTLWTKRLDRPPKIVPTDVSVDESGTVVQRSEFGPIPVRGIGGIFVEGEPYEVVLISADQSIRAFAKTIPFPIETREGRCLLSVELLSAKGDGFAISGQEFEANEEIVAVSQYEGDRVESRLKTSPDGKFIVVQFPPVMAKQAGAASFTAIGKFCKPTVSYKWGLPTLKTDPFETGW